MKAPPSLEPHSQGWGVLLPMVELRYLISGVVISAASESEAPLLVQGARPERDARRHQDTVM